MMGHHHFTRVDTQELKDHIYRKIGHQRAEKYFDHLKRYLGLKLSKIDFDKSCVRTIGRENIHLHNKLIQSILQNACQAKTPPHKSRKVEGLNVKVTNGYQRTCLQSLYGDAFPQSPRKCRSPVNRDRKFRDRPSPLGPLGKSPSMITCEETVTRNQENQSPTELHSFCSKPREEGEEVEQILEGNFSARSWSNITAPLGISVNNNARKDRDCGVSYNTFTESCQNSCELPGTESLRNLVQKKLALEGVGVSLECADLLNNSLDVFLKRLIKPCLDLAGSRCSKRVSMSDFRVAMESKPCLLGQDWSTQLEKICHYDFGG
ncbi:hypothetical protein ABFS82_02G042300 [Erythranthe guttata]|uniref:Transcriptional coactivator Hfi1/Transcriptional adapter 1 n=1 Tax=Erythranthe guttata TaxID=4155 RepID=A0A022RD03_ERYGU|nr:PREDICTED: uncharacterized protein LOC105957489 [Erythranthe guttata]EYU37588.1 hypothetical protein MIMGU_mgv1a010205mg [Erythranthe guttata]|eukprot:XP_012836863.1 PREDICTED: uncharacterized protein LOC105957489 [Erythranthe guttata]